MPYARSRVAEELSHAVERLAKQGRTDLAADVPAELRNYNVKLIAPCEAKGALADKLEVKDMSADKKANTAIYWDAKSLWRLLRSNNLLPKTALDLAAHVPPLSAAELVDKQTAAVVAELWKITLTAAVVVDCVDTHQLMGTVCVYLLLGAPSDGVVN